MRNANIAAITVALLLGSPAVAQTAPQELEAAARALVSAEMAGIGQEMLEGMRSAFRGNGYSAAEQAALEAAFDAEAPAFLSGMETAMAESAARHVPLEQIRADADFDTPEWTAAGDETVRWAEGAAIELAGRVAEKGCSIEASPSEQCVTVLRRIQEARATRSSNSAD